MPQTRRTIEPASCTGSHMQFNERDAFWLHSGRPCCSHEMMSPHTIETIKSHFGGDGMLACLGADAFVVNHDHVSFRLTHPNPKGVRSVVISIESVKPHEFFTMDCYGAIAPGRLTAPLIGTARQIIPENLATVLGKLTGIETMHHRHY